MIGRCVCYNNSDTVSCSGSISTIKIGHWFRLVENKPTVSICPNNYCNFTCCEATNGYYQLSPLRTNQCNSHRTGTACGTVKPIILCPLTQLNVSALPNVQQGKQCW